MSLAAGDFFAGGSLTAAFLAFGGRVRSVANRCSVFEERLKVLEGKCTLVDVHETILHVGEEKMAEGKAQLENLNKKHCKITYTRRENRW